MREFLRFKKRLKCSDGIKATVQQNILSSFHQRIGGTMDKFLELIAEDIEFGATEILKDTCETRREDQLVLPSACQEKHQVISPTTAHRQEVLPQIDNLCNFLDSTENVSINSSEAIVSSNSTNKLWTKKKRDTSYHYIEKLQYRHTSFTKTLKKLAENLAQQCDDEIKTTIFNLDKRKLDTFYTENIYNNIEPRRIILPTSPEVITPTQPVIVSNSHLPLKSLRLPMLTDKQNYNVASFQTTSQEPSPSLANVAQCIIATYIKFAEDQWKE